MSILGVVGLMPRLLQKQVLDLFGRQDNRGDDQRPRAAAALYLAGAPVQQIMFWVPQSGDVAVACRFFRTTAACSSVL